MILTFTIVPAEVQILEETGRTRQLDIVNSKGINRGSLRIIRTLFSKTLYELTIGEEGNTTKFSVYDTDYGLSGDFDTYKYNVRLDGNIVTADVPENVYNYFINGDDNELSIS